MSDFPAVDAMDQPWYEPPLFTGDAEAALPLLAYDGGQTGAVTVRAGAAAADARGAIVGLSRFNTKEHLARATLEAICHQSADVVAVMVDDVDPSLAGHLGGQRGDVQQAVRASQGEEARGDGPVRALAVGEGRPVGRPSSLQGSGCGSTGAAHGAPLVAPVAALATLAPEQRAALPLAGA